MVLYAVPATLYTPYALEQSLEPQFTYLGGATIHEFHCVGVLADILWGKSPLHRSEINMNIPSQMNLAVFAP